jgi:hypothetical protein
MPDLLVEFLNIYGRLFISALFIEWGLCLWQNRKFCKKNILSFFLLAIGMHFIVCQ